MSSSTAHFSLLLKPCRVWLLRRKPSHRAQYFLVLDRSISQLKERFDQPGIETYMSLENGFLNGSVKEGSEPYPEINSDNIDAEIARFRGLVGEVSTVAEDLRRFRDLQPEIRLCVQV